MAAPNAGVAAAAVAAALNPPKPEGFAGVANAPDANELDDVVDAAAAPNGDVVAADVAGAAGAPAPLPAFSRSSFSASCALAYPAFAFAKNAELNPPVVAAGFASGVDGAESAAPGDVGGETAAAAAVAAVAGDADVAGDDAAAAVAGAAAAAVDANENVDAVCVDSPNAGAVTAADALAAVEAAANAGAAAPDPNAGAVDAGSVNAGVEDALVVAPPNENVGALAAAAAAKGDAVDAAAGFDVALSALSAPALSRSSCSACCAAA